MEQLIKITQENGSIVVSARELHKFLEATERFSTWIERQFQYGFEEKIDYIGCKEFNALANQELNDFALTIDTAKEISMLQKSEKGKIARKYFLECEKQLEKRQDPKQLSRKELAYMVIEAEERAERLQLEIDTKHKPRSQFVDQVFNSDSLISASQATKILGLNFGRNTLLKELREKGIFFKSSNEPKQYYIERGYFEVKENVFHAPDGKKKIKLQTFITQKGLGFIAKTFNVVQTQHQPVKFLSA